MESESEQQDSNKKQNVGPKNLEKFVQSLKQAFVERSLENQKQEFGPLLKMPLPVIKHSVDPFFLPYIGSANLEKFYQHMGTATQNAQDNHLLAIAQASGAGKTRLCFAVGHDPATAHFAIFIRFCENDIPSRTLTWLIRKMEDAKRYAEHCLHLFRLFVYAHVEWALQVANYFDDIQQAREACLRALQNGDGQTGVSEILDKEWIHFSQLTTDKAESDYLANYLKKINVLVQDKKMLLFFDEVGFLNGKLPNTFVNLDDYTEQNKPTAGRQNPDLYYGLRLLIVKLRQLLESWKICIADTHFSIFSVIEVANNSPIRDQVVPFSELHKLTIDEITEYLHSLFEIDLSAAPKRLMELLKSFQGRPKFFFSFLVMVIDALKRHRWDTEQKMFSGMEQCAVESFKISKTTMKAVLNKYVMENRAFGTTERTTRKLVAQIFIASVFDQQTMIHIQNKDVNADIVAKGLMMSSSAEDNQTYRKEDEPIFFEALEELAIESKFDFVADYLASPCAIIQFARSAKGVATEYLLAWYFIKAVRVGGKQTLHGLLKDLVPQDFILLDSWLNVFVETRRGWSTKADLEAPDVVGLANNEDYSTLQYDMHQNVGPDICFLVNVKKRVKQKIVHRMGVVAIQCKARQTFQFADALRSVQLGYLWTEAGHRDTIEKYLDNDDEIELTADQVAKFKKNQAQREGVYSCVEANKSLKSNWFRVIYSSQPWPADLVEKVNDYNHDHEFTPIVLITMGDQFFSTEIQKILKSEEDSKCLPNPRNPNFQFINHTTAQRIDAAIKEGEEEDDDEE